MVASGMRFETRHASRYLERLCRRLARRAHAEFDAEEGRIDLPLGPCHLSAKADSLALVVEAEDEDRLAHLQWVVANHLQRVVLNEPLTVHWTPTW